MERLPRIYYLVRYPETRLDHVAGLRFRSPAISTALTANEIAQRLRAHKYRAVPTESGVFAERGRYARFGVQSR